MQRYHTCYIVFIEGEWRADTWHGLGCLNARGVERFIGRPA